MAGLLNTPPYGGGLLGSQQSSGLLGGIANFFRPWTPEDRARVAAVMPPDLAPTQIVKGMVGGAANLAMQANEAMPWGGNNPQAIGYDPRAGTVDPSKMIPFASNVAGYATTGAMAAPAVQGGVGMGIRAWHASPHDFDRFDRTKMGTGEGAQVYGAGHYLAENPEVSGKGGQYDKQFSADPRYIEVGEERIPVTRNLRESMTPRDRAAYFAAKGDIDAAIRLHDQKARELESGIRPTSFQREAGWGDLDLLRGTVTELEALKAAGARPAPAKIYEVDIDASPDEFLDWDKPMSEQSAKVREALTSMPEFSGRLDPEDPLISGHNIMAQWDQPAETSEKLRAAGIKGIRYKDAGSRIDGDAAKIMANYGSREKALEVAEQRLSSAHYSDRAYWEKIVKELSKSETSNYVVFDDNTLDILKKYGIAGLTAGGAGAAMLGGTSDPASAAAPSYSTGGRF